jgi:hypothetical protein
MPENCAQDVNRRVLAVRGSADIIAEGRRATIFFSGQGTPPPRTKAVPPSGAAPGEWQG